ncbi:MAG: penicillin-binding protein [Oscillospiraceae bacterium]|nr:penicillin-binding protein [Oscillospiraceae bacterium]
MSNAVSKQKQERKKKKPSRKLRVVKKLISILLTTLLSIFLICIITGTIVAAAVAVYILDFMDEASTVTIEEMELSYNTNIYGYDEDGELETLYQVNNAVQRIPVPIDKIPQHTVDAFVYTEDERFYMHDGVDYKNTIAACLNMVLHFWDSERGGSTITQQLIKNITGEDTRSPSRKIREVFRAMTLEKNYSKQKIIETYLNYIGFGGTANGIEMAAIKYFGKNVQDLTVAESAVLAAIPQSPEAINPFAGYIDDFTGEKVNTGRARNRERQEYVLWQMYDHGAISYDEYQAALVEHIIYTDTDEYKELHPELKAKDYDPEDSITSWVVDAAILEVEDYLMDTYAIDRDTALTKINTGGYQIYVTIDKEMQEYVEEKYLDLNNLINTRNSARYNDTNGDGVIDDRDEVVYPQSAFVAMNYKGEVLACVGAVGEKKDSLVWNYAVRETRQPGSTIKPVAGYGYGIYTDEFHWGSKLQDSGLTMPDGSIWPKNYSSDSVSSNYSYDNKHIYYGLMKSLNTISARLVDALTPDAVFRFSTEKMGLELTELDPQGHSDKNLSPLSVGALTYGVTVKNMVNAYVPYGNGGTYYKAHIVSRLEQGNHEIVYENDGHPHEAVDPETAYVMNRMMKNVVSAQGTAGAAQLANKEVVGKTGTTQNWDDLWFIGLTEDFVSGVWIGYKNREKLDTSINSAQMWYNIIGEYANNIDSGATYPECDSVIAEPMCSNTGLIAGAYCPKGETGYWKSTNAPVCTSCKNYSSRGNRKSYNSNSNSYNAPYTEKENMINSESENTHE